MTQRLTAEGGVVRVHCLFGEVTEILRFKRSPIDGHQEALVVVNHIDRHWVSVKNVRIR